MATLDLEFNSVSELRRWLRDKNEDAGSPEAYDKWLQAFFGKGNTIVIHGEEWDYWACWELL